eukprot:7018373-Karenia_brevis.AAC.1
MQGIPLKGVHDTFTNPWQDIVSGLSEKSKKSLAGNAYHGPSHCLFEFYVLSTCRQVPQDIPAELQLDLQPEGFVAEQPASESLHFEEDAVASESASSRRVMMMRRMKTPDEDDEDYDYDRTRTT